MLTVTGLRADSHRPINKVAGEALISSLPPDTPNLHKPIKPHRHLQVFIHTNSSLAGQSACFWKLIFTTKHNRYHFRWPRRISKHNRNHLSQSLLARFSFPGRLPVKQKTPKIQNQQKEDAKQGAQQRLTFKTGIHNVLL